MDVQNLIHKSQLPTQLQWREFESNRLLLEPRKQVVAIVFRLIATLALIRYAPFVLVTVWVVLIFGSNFWMQRFIHTYEQLLSKQPYLSMMTPALEAVVRGYKKAWLINCLIWGFLSFLSQFWLPDAPRLVCAVILNALMFFSITRTCADRRLMHRVSALLVTSQFVFVVLRFVIFNDSFPARVDDADRFIAYTFYFCLMAYLLWAVGDRFNQIHLQRLDVEYSKLQIIETLSESQYQLRIEQEALVSANKLVQQFYSGAAHDLRQPVYAMQLYTAMLSDDPSQNTHLLPKIAQSCIGINDMFNTLFDYQQTHMYDTDLVEKDICIQDTFKNLALHFQPIASGKGLQIRFRPMDGSIRMVPLYLVRILSNLIANALRYTSQGGVLVSARKTQTNFRFEIWDTGIGIDDSNMQKIFNEFYKVNHKKANYLGLVVEKTHHEGLGLGLAIVKKLSSRLKDTDILVRSRLGRGTVFTFTVPLDRFKVL
jgi:signal transduction histidine kinase